MTTIMLNQKKSSSFLSSLLFFIGITSLIFTFFFLGKIHYQQSKYESGNYKFPKEVFEPLPDEDLPPAITVKREKLKRLSNSETLKRITAQNKWKSTTLLRFFSGNKKVDGKISKFLDVFYWKFLKEGLKKNERKWWEENNPPIRPKKVDGRTTTKETLTSDIEKCKKIFPKAKEAEISWKKFGGWLTEEEKGEKEKDNTVLMGLCVTKKNTGMQWKKSWGKESICYWTVGEISIKLKPELFYFRHNSWVTIDKNPMEPQQLKVGWKELIETIAHELAHAVINTILIDEKVAKLVEGHGGLHDNFTEKIKGMIERSDEYTDFKNYIESLDKFR